MKKSFCRWIVTTLASALLWAAFAGRPAIAQTQAGEIASSARIYGYDLAEGNWTLEQVQCRAMPKVSLLHYRRTFSDGTESRLTAVVPLAGGHVRIVPVLYRNATPYLPAPVNPRNYALFNELVRGSAAKGTWLDLSACYAALTGAGSGLHSEIGIAGAPRPTVHLGPGSKTHLVTFATREGQSSYTVWNVSFDRFGRVTNASTEDESVYAGKTPSPVFPRAARERQKRAEAERPGEKIHPKSQERAVNVEAAREIRSAPQEHAANAEAESESPAQGTLPQQQQSSDEAGWKFIPKPPEPPSKIIPEPRQPSDAVLPN
jgi:hypothetical protein